MPLEKDITVIIEGICYLYPHKRELVSTHPAMIGTWQTCLKLLKQNKGSILAPLLVDDINRDGFNHVQTVDDLLGSTVDRKYSDLRWLGDQVMESKFERQYGNLGCKAFDSLYHRDVILGLLLIKNWKWISVNPTYFKKQQAGMHENLWSLVSEHISFVAVASSMGRDSQVVRKECRDDFLARFLHYWIDNEGKVESITRPWYEHGRIHHKTI